MTYYNDREPFAAAWLRELMADGQITQGDVDERDVWDIVPQELREYRRVHLFAGIGGWDYALRLAGWPDDAEVWTVSCPCQPFSTAGKKRGVADERHLWPAAFHLIDALRPRVVFGEQVASRDGLAWLDIVLSDLEGAGYATGAVDCCAAGLGAPHIRQRLWFVALDDGAGRAAWRPESLAREDARHVAISSGAHGGLAVSEHAERGAEQPEIGERGGRSRLGGNGSLGNASGTGLEGRRQRGDGADEGAARSASVALGLGDTEGGNGEVPVRTRRGGSESGGTGGPVNGFWSDAEWLWCRDRKYRPAGPGIFPLAHGVQNRMGTLRGAGNAIVPEVAAAFITASMARSVPR